MTSQQFWETLVLGVLAGLLVNPIWRGIKFILRAPWKMIGGQFKAGWKHVGIFNFVKESPLLITVSQTYYVGVLVLNFAFFIVVSIIGYDILSSDPPWQSSFHTLASTLTVVLWLYTVYRILTRWLPLWIAYGLLVEWPHQQSTLSKPKTDAAPLSISFGKQETPKPAPPPKQKE